MSFLLKGYFLSYLNMVHYSFKTNERLKLAQEGCRSYCSFLLQVPQHVGQDGLSIYRQIPNAVVDMFVTLHVNQYIPNLYFSYILGRSWKYDSKVSEYFVEDECKSLLKRSELLREREETELDVGNPVV